MTGNTAVIGVRDDATSGPVLRRRPAAGARQAQGIGQRGEHYRDPRVGQGTGHRGNGPQPGTRRAGGQVQRGDRELNELRLSLTWMSAIRRMASMREKAHGHRGNTRGDVTHSRWILSLVSDLAGDGARRRRPWRPHAGNRGPDRHGEAPRRRAWWSRRSPSYPRPSPLPRQLGHPR